MIGPKNIFLSLNKTRLQRLNLAVTFMEDGIEFDIAKIDALDFVFGLFGTFLISICQASAKTVRVGVTLNDKDVFHVNGILPLMHFYKKKTRNKIAGGEFREATYPDYQDTCVAKSICFGIRNRCVCFRLCLCGRNRRL